ncbi:MAG: hypothetical protein ACE37F_01475 [Nannocystaceae bacterium]|nr:hypothetical protein [bacterium]
MALNWIVPARRVVIASEATSYADVLEGWLEELREHRDVLLGWYRHLSPSALGPGFDRALRFAQEWVEAFTGGPPPEREVSAAPEDESHFDEVGFWARLWDGPLRVLLHEEADGDAQSEAQTDAQVPDTAPIRTELEHGGSVVVILDRHERVVLNHDATLLPGDVLELPLFRLLHLAGLSAFEGASFDPEGSCFLGTAVVDAEGRPDGAVWLHDNLVAMRFQLLLSAARGAFHSFTSGFSDDEQTRKANPATLGDRTVHARGVIYGGSLAPPHQPTFYRLHDYHWGDKNVPTKETLDGLAEGTRLTTGWACSPCALNLLAFMSVHEGHWGGGSVNRHARGDNGSGAWARDIAHYDHFHHTFRQCGGAAGLEMNAQRLGLSAEDSTSENVRAFALERMFGRAMQPTALEGEPDEDDDEDDDAPPLSSVPPSEDVLERGHAAAQDNPDPELDAHDDSLEPHTHAPRLDVGSLLPGNEVVSRTKDEVLEYLEGAAFASVGLNGHEYSWVVVHSPRALLDEPVQSATLGPRPPQAGPISAYDPLTGEPQATGQTPELFIFEATGSFHPYRLLRAREGEEGFGYTVFKVRPFRWSKVDRVLFQRLTTMRTRGRGEQRRRVEEERDLKIGEDASYSRRPQVRAKPLLGISRASSEQILARHRASRVFAPLYLHHLRGRNVQREYQAVGYATRAVPFPTLAESNEDTRFASLDDTRQTLGTHSSHLRRHRDELRALKRRADSLSAADVALLEARIPGGRSFERMVELEERALRSAHDGRVQRLERDIVTLRRQLTRHCAPDEGASPEQRLHERASYRVLLEDPVGPPVPRRRMSRRERNAERWQTRARRYRDKRAELAGLHDNSDARWASLARRSVIIEWITHVQQMLALVQ